MPRRPITDPVVLAAMFHAGEKRRKQQALAAVRAAIEELGAGTLAEIAAAADLERAECGAALDKLLIDGELEVVTRGVYALPSRAASESSEPVPF